MQNYEKDLVSEISKNDTVVTNS
jgi:hypothetical protein